jgi:hypothetical protein
MADINLNNDEFEIFKSYCKKENIDGIKIKLYEHVMTKT